MTHTEQNTTNVVTILCFISFYFAIVHCLIVLPCVCHVVQLLLPEVVSLRSLFTFNHCVVRCMYVFACADLQAIHSQPAMDTMYWRYAVTLSHIVASSVVFFVVLLSGVARYVSTWQFLDRWRSRGPLLTLAVFQSNSPWAQAPCDKARTISDSFRTKFPADPWRN